MAVTDPNLTPEQQKQVDALKRAAFSSFYNRMRMQASRGRRSGGISFGRAASQLKESDFGLKGVEDAFLQGGIEDVVKDVAKTTEEFYVGGGLEDALKEEAEDLGQSAERVFKPETEDKLKEQIAKQTEEVRKITEKQKKRLSDEQRQFAVRRAARARARRAGRTSLVSPGRLGYGGTLGA